MRRALKRRRRGKIAHLPESVHEQINLMLQDGVPYAQIIARLGPAGVGLNKDNLSRWRKTNYQDWYQEQLWLEAVRRWPHLARHESAGRMAMLMTEFDAESLSQTLYHDPGKLPPLLKAIAYLSDAACIPDTPVPTNETPDGPRNATLLSFPKG
jgi:hypothetical protein